MASRLGFSPAPGPPPLPRLDGPPLEAPPPRVPLPLNLSYLCNEEDNTRQLTLSAIVVCL
jgi:hypothetical protein